MENRAESIRRLREDLEAMYREGLQALAILERIPDRAALAAGRAKASPSHNNGSNRSIVFDALDEDYRGIETLSEITGLSVPIVRGVLYAPSLQGSFDKKKFGKEARFKKKRGDEVSYAEEIACLVRTLKDLAKERIGALIVLRGKDLILRHLEGGEELNGRFSEALLKSLFFYLHSNYAHALTLLCMSNSLA